MEKKENKKEALKWLATIIVLGFLYVTDLHKPIVAGVQKLILSTGLIQPDITEDKVMANAIDLNVLLVSEYGDRINLKDYSGKVLFINFWATWCPPCRAEMPGIQTLFEKVGKENVEFVMITSDRDFNTAIAYKKKYGFTFPIYQLQSQLPKELESQILPTTYVINSHRQIVTKEQGMAQYDSAKFERFIRRLIANE